VITDLKLTELEDEMDKSVLLDTVLSNQTLLNSYIDKLETENETYKTLINSPEINNFIEGLKLESSHQTIKWGNENEENKFPHDYALVMDKLKGKLALSIWDRNIDKYKHHLITMAALCYNIHRQFIKPGTAIYDYFNNKKNDVKIKKSVEQSLRGQVKK